MSENNEPELDDDEVRRALAGDDIGDHELARVLYSAARAYLRMREQQQHKVCICGHSEGMHDPWTHVCGGASTCDCISFQCSVEGCDCADATNQQPAPAPTIAQVVEACGAWPEQQWIGVSVKMRQLEWEARPLAAVTVDFIPATADTPDAALRKLYDDAVKRLEQQRDEAAEKLAKLKGAL